MTPDADIVAAVKEGNRDRYAELVERHQRMVYGIAWSRLGNAELCEDAAQETFVKAFRYLVALRDPAKFPMWLARIARNVSMSFLRTRKREIEQHERWRLETATAHTSPQVEEAPSVDRALADTLAALPEQHRECLVLFYLEGRSVHDAAERLGVSETAMKTRLHRARAALRDRLEETLESGLSGLGPRSGFTAGVMPLLPSMPIAAGLGGASALGKLLGGLGKLAVSFPMMSLVPFALPAVMFGWLAHLESANLAPSPARAIRARTAWREAATRYSVLILLIGLVVILIEHLAVSRDTLIAGVGLFSLWGTYATARMLRVNRLPFTVANVATNGMFAVVSLAIGLLHAPYWLFLVVLVPVSLLFHYYADRSRPRRRDYSVFLRQAIGLLGTPNAEAPKRLALTRTQLHGFVRFLGARFLARDYRFIDDGIVILLPPVRTWIEDFTGWNSSNSSVTVDSDGSATASIGSKDLRDLRALVGSAVPEKDSMEQDVARVVEGALQLFATGQADQAEALLQSEKDADVFRRPVAKSREHRFRGILAVIGACGALFLYVWLPTNVGVLNARSGAATIKQIRTALVSWAGDSRPRHPELGKLTGCAKWPPLGALGNEAQQRAFKEAVMQWLGEGNEGRPRQCIYENLFDPRLLWLSIDSGTLSMDDLASLGLTASGVREYLTNKDGFAIRMMGLPPASGLGSSAAGCEITDIAGMARQLACLKAFGCLDLVDAQRIAVWIAAKQITPSWVMPKDHLPIEPAAGVGLFDFSRCDLRTTHAALWALQTLDKLDLVDRETCVNAILRYHAGQGRFSVPASARGIDITGSDTDGYFAMESLAILGALNRVKDLNAWKFRPTMDLGVRWWAVQSWAFQLRLEELRRKR